MNLRSFLIFLFFFMPIIFATNLMAQTSARPTADTIYIHANIYTGVVGDASFHTVQRAEAMAVRGDKLIAVGSESDVMKLKGPRDEAGRSARTFCDARLQRCAHAFDRGRPQDANG